MWCSSGSATPDGVYCEEYYSPKQYFCFNGGRVVMKPVDPQAGTKTFDTQATYSRSNGIWVMRGAVPTEPNGQEVEVVLKPMPFGLRMVCESKNHPEWNRFCPRRGFVWAQSLGLLPPSRTNALN